MRTLQLVWVFECQAEYFLLVIFFIALFILIVFWNKILFDFSSASVDCYIFFVMSEISLLLVLFDILDLLQRLFIWKFALVSLGWFLCTGIISNTPCVWWYLHPKECF